jgi:hypothetical protein
MDTVRRIKQITEKTSIRREARFVLLMLHFLGVLPLQTSSITGIKLSIVTVYCTPKCEKAGQNYISGIVHFGTIVTKRQKIYSQ